MKRKIIETVRALDHRLFFPYLKETETEACYKLHDTQYYRFPAETLVHLPPAIAAYFRNANETWMLEKFHFHYPDRCTIEPSTGWGVTTANRLIPQSMWNCYIHRDNKPMFLKYRLFPHETIKLERAISLQYAWRNYWHFHNDILGQLKLADEAGLARDTPVIIPAGLAQTNYFRDITNASKELQGRKWILQGDGTHISCGEAHFFNTFWAHRDNFDAVLDYMDLRPRLGRQHAGDERIFITRSAARGRNIINMHEIEAVLKKHAFRLVDCDGISLQEQMELFRNAAYVIGIHGAGLTNMIYRQGRPLNMLEIFSSDFFNPCYYWMCMQYGFGYFAVQGSAYTERNTKSGSFSVDAGAFDEAVSLMLKQ